MPQDSDIAIYEFQKYVSDKPAPEDTVFPLQLRIHVNCSTLKQSTQYHGMKNLEL